MININLLEYLSSQIGNTSWCGDALFDDIASSNLDKLDNYLREIEEIREVLLLRLHRHKTYTKGNGSAEHLHNKAKMIMERHIIKEFTHTDFEKYWEDDDD